MARDRDATSAPSRRTILAAVGIGAMATSAPLASGVAAASATASRAGSRPIVVNALGGLENPNLALARPPGPPADTARPDIDARAIADAHASGLTAVNITLGYVAGEMDPYEYTIATIGMWDRILRDHPADLLKVNSAADIERAGREGRIGVIYGFQNAVQIGEKLERIDTFADLGVGVIQLTYNPANALGDGSMAPLNRGLTPFGRAVVERLNANRVMVDLSHSGERTCLDAIAASAAPISINHTGCRALNDLPRNKTDAELRGVAEKGGFVGVYFMPFLSPAGHAHAADVIAHIDHAVGVCGEDHVGVGTDGSVTTIDDLTAYQAHLAREVADRAKAGIGAKGERADTYPFAVDLRGVDQFRKLEGLLAARGYSATRIEKIMGLNFVAFARQVWGA
jgi:membrane dipeptidase